MDKLVQFGRKAWFVVRVLSGYEERRIRAHRLQMQQRIARVRLCFLLLFFFNHATAIFFEDISNL
jgi:hypothetical protein